MGLLTDNIKQIITEVRPGIIATADRYGKPNVSAKGSLRVLDDDHLVFADMSSPRTITNLKENSQISILIFHPKSMKGCRIWGKGEVHDSGYLFGQICNEYSERNITVNNIVLVTVEQAQESF